MAFFTCPFKIFLEFQLHGISTIYVRISIFFLKKCYKKTFLYSCFYIDRSWSLKRKAHAECRCIRVRIKSAVSRALTSPINRISWENPLPAASHSVARLSTERRAIHYNILSGCCGVTSCTTASLASDAFCIMVLMCTWILVAIEMWSILVSPAPIIRTVRVTRTAIN
jgi:hypothetical protein